MTYINLTYNDSNRKFKEYQIEVITYDGDSETVYVTARTAAEAQAKAVDMVPNADITLVQCTYEYC